jgi:hypothetical protein
MLLKVNRPSLPDPTRCDELMVRFREHEDAGTWDNDAIKVDDSAVNTLDPKGTIVNLVVIFIRGGPIARPLSGQCSEGDGKHRAQDQHGVAHRLHDTPRSWRMPTSKKVDINRPMFHWRRLFDE